MRFDSGAARGDGAQTAARSLTVGDCTIQLCVGIVRDGSVSIAGVMPMLVATVKPTPTGDEAGYGIGVSDVGLGTSLAR